MGRDCSIELAVPASSSLCALSVAPAVAAVDASARAAVNHLQRYLLEHHSFLPCPATMTVLSCEGHAVHLLARLLLTSLFMGVK